MTINNITRMLDAKGIPYTALQIPEEKLGALETAQFLGVDPANVYKTIVVVRERGKPILAVIPGPLHVDLKAVAAILGEKKVSLPTEKEAEDLTGLLAGGISPLALIHKGFQVLFSSQAERENEIHVSGGQRGLILRMPVTSLVQMTQARMASISK